MVYFAKKKEVAALLVTLRGLIKKHGGAGEDIGGERHRKRGGGDRERKSMVGRGEKE